MTERMTVAELAQHQWDNISERRFQDFIVNVARRAGWHIMHTRPAQNGRGDWRTPIQGDTGYPDLTMAKKGSAVMVWELKSESGRVTDAQQGWLVALGVPERAVNARMGGLWWPAGRGVCVGVVRPSMRVEAADELGVQL